MAPSDSAPTLVLCQVMPSHVHLFSENLSQFLDRDFGYGPGAVAWGGGKKPLLLFESIQAEPERYYLLLEEDASAALYTLN